MLILFLIVGMFGLSYMSAEVYIWYQVRYVGYLAIWPNNKESELWVWTDSWIPLEEEASEKTIRMAMIDMRIPKGFMLHPFAPKLTPSDEVALIKTTSVGLSIINKPSPTHKHLHQMLWEM